MRGGEPIHSRDHVARHFLPVATPIISLHPYPDVFHPSTLPLIRSILLTNEPAYRETIVQRKHKQIVVLINNESK